MPPPVPSLRIHPSRQPMASDHILSATFPPPPVREGDDSLDSMDPRYRPFLPLSPPYSPFPRLRPTRFLPSRCLEQWFADGETLCGEAELGGEEKLDATWLWVNGSDERWRERACCNGASRKGSILPSITFGMSSEETGAHKHQGAERSCSSDAVSP
jgi:3-O-alpha-D-mannopyranosyl-alpha-D-mannopyranose xylosylphosphotransferase